MPYISFVGTLNGVKFIAVSEILFLIFALFILIICGSLIAIKNNINVAFGKLFTLNSIFIFILFIIIATNIKDARLLNIDDSLFSAAFAYDFYSRKFINLLLVFMTIVLLIIVSYYDKKILTSTFEYTVIVIISFIGMYLLLITRDLFLWFLAIELQSFCFYALAAYRTNRSFMQTEAGLKYFIFGSLASSLYLFGISLLYLLFGTLNLDSITALNFFPLGIYNQYVFNIALLLIFFSLFFKLGIAPFHFWVPQVYTYASSIVTFLFILLPKIPLFYILFLLIPFDFSYVLELSLVLSISIGTILAFHFSSFKTFMAYSAIANNAFFIAPILFKSFVSFFAFIFYLFSYNILVIIIFISSLFFRRYDLSAAFNNLRDVIIFKKSNIIYALVFSFAFLSLAGIPPFIGFFSKFFILLSALSFSSYFLIFVLLAFSLVAAYYYIRLIKIIFFSSTLKYISLTSMPAIPTYIIAIGSLINIFFIFFPTYVFVIISLLG